MNLWSGDFMPSDLKMEMKEVKLWWISVSTLRWMTLQQSQYYKDFLHFRKKKRGKRSVNLMVIFFSPWCEESGGLVWTHTEDELPLRIPAQVLDCIKVSWYDHPGSPLTLRTQLSLRRTHTFITHVEKRHCFGNLLSTSAANASDGVIHKSYVVSLRSSTKKHATPVKVRQETCFNQSHSSLSPKDWSCLQYTATQSHLKCKKHTSQ